MAFWSRKPKPDPLTSLRQEIKTRFNKLGGAVEDIRLRQGTKPPPQAQVQMAVRGLRRQTPSTLGYQSARGLLSSAAGPGTYQGSPYNLSEIAKALDVEGYFARAIQRQVTLCMKQGWRIRGRDNQRVRYIQKRLAEICLVSDTTFGQLLREIFSNCLIFSNHFMVTKRDPMRSSGGRTRVFGRTYEPIAGIYVADPTTMMVKQSKSGLIESWKQDLGSTLTAGTQRSRQRTFRHQDVIHVFLDRRAGFIFGTPYVVPVLDDMRLLRRLEELVDIIAHKHAFPFMVVKVGTDDKPADEVMLTGGALVPEVDVARQEFENLEFEGGIVVTERYDVQLIGAEGKALDLKPYLEHLEARVLGGLRLSEIDLGRGDSANRNTAQSITKALVDACTDVQRIVEDTITEKLFFQLLMEGDFPVDLSNPEEDKVFLDFPPIDTEEQRAQENHITGLWEGNLITEEEARLGMGRKPLTDADREGLYMALVTEPTSEMETEAAQKVEKTKAATKSKTQPANQHGKSATKPKVSKNRLEQFEEAYIEQVDYHFRLACDNFLAGLNTRPGRDPNIGENWKKTARPQLLDSLGTETGYQGVRLIHYLRSSEAGAVVDARTYLTPVVELGFREALGTAQVEKDYISKAQHRVFFQDHVRESLKSQLRASSVHLMRDWEREYIPSSLDLRSQLEVYGQDLVNCAKRHVQLAYAFGFSLGAEARGADAIEVAEAAEGSSCARCAPREISLPAELQVMVCFRTDCRVKYAIAGKDRTDVSVP